jgi:hypothetical protein
VTARDFTPGGEEEAKFFEVPYRRTGLGHRKGALPPTKPKADRSDKGYLDRPLGNPGAERGQSSLGAIPGCERVPNQARDGLLTRYSRTEICMGPVLGEH